MPELPDYCVRCGHPVIKDLFGVLIHSDGEPGHPQIGERERLVVGVDHSPKLPPLRLSMTAPLMARSRRTWVLTAGSGKAEALARALAEPNNPATPASFATGTEECIWFTEPSAAAGVPETGTAH